MNTLNNLKFKVMKIKILLTLSLIFILMIGFSQTKTITISESKIGTITCKYEKEIDIENSDTTYYLMLLFQNSKYLHITDFKAIYFNNQQGLNDFISDLSAALPEMNTKSDISWRKEAYCIDVNDFSKYMYIYEKPSKGSGYTILSKKQVEKLILWLKNINIGKS